MKKILFFIILFLLPLSAAHAQTISGAGYTLTATPKDYTATIVVERPSASTYPLATYSGFTANIPIGAIGIAAPRLDKNFPIITNEQTAIPNTYFNGKSGVQLSQATFIANVLKPGTTYYTQVVIKKNLTEFGYIGPILEFKTTQPSVLSVVGPTVSVGSDAQGFKTFVVTGGVDRAKHNDPGNFSVKVEVSQTSDFSTIVVASPEYVTINSSTGMYEWIERSNTMSIDREYDVRQTITYKPTGQTQVTLGKFNTKTGTAPLPTATVMSNFKKQTYEFLAPLPGFKYFYDPELCAEKSETDKTVICDINDLLNFAFKFMIGLAAVMLVLRLMIEGYTYLVSDIPGVKGTAKSHIVEATLGLLLALTAYIILNTVNPKLVNNTVSLSKATLEIEDYGGDSPLIPGTPGSGKGGTGYDFSKVTFPAGIQCPKTGGSSSIAAIAVSFKDRVVYSQGRAWKSEPPRGTTGNGKIHLDCSSYVNTVLKCAGIEPPAGAFTGDIFASAPLIKSIETSGSTSTITTSDGKKVVLKPGDLVGWKPGDGSKGSGHVLMYIGNNTLRDVRNYKGFNGAGEEKLSTWASSRINNGYKLRVLKVIP